MDDFMRTPPQEETTSLTQSIPLAPNPTYNCWSFDDMFIKPLYLPSLYDDDTHPPKRLKAPRRFLLKRRRSTKENDLCLV